MPIGSRVRCECAEVLVVEPRRAHVPRPMKCGRCGGPLAADASKCGYCDGEITLEERRLSDVCPKCFARLLAGARFCMECGVEIAPQALRAVAVGAACPRCRGGLRSRSIGAESFVECTACAGLWVGQEVLERICAKTDLQELVGQALRGVPPSRPVDPSEGRAYLPCPTCTDLMVRRNFGGSSGVLVDVCRGHGVWLDHRELERILEFVRKGGLLKAREQEVERLRREAERAKAQVLAGPAPCAGDAIGGEEIGLLDALQWLGSRLSRSRGLLG